MNYVYGKVKAGRYACRLTGLKQVEDEYELRQGISRSAEWPEEAYFKMSENFPDRLQLEDFLRNTSNLLVISERLRVFLDGENLKNNEVLPVKIINHKGRMVKEKYYILNQHTLQDCIDLDKSVVRVNPLDPESFMSVRKLVINEKGIDSELAIFRMARYPSLPIFRRDLAEKIHQRSFTGIAFGEVEDWEGK